jgi:hypothetical protein
VNPTRNIFVPIFDASQHLITLMTYLSLLLTYGAVFPPLAVCFTVTTAATVLFTKLKVGRFLVNAREANLPGQVAIVEQECAGVGEPGILLRAVSMIAVSAGVFYTLFLFDTLGDERGLSGAFWVLIVMPLLPPSGICLIAWYSNHHEWHRNHLEPGICMPPLSEVQMTASPLTNDVRSAATLGPYIMRFA